MYVNTLFFQVAKSLIYFLKQINLLRQVLVIFICLYAF